MLIEFGRGLVVGNLMRGCLVDKDGLAVGLLLLGHIDLAVHEIGQSCRGMDMLHEGRFLSQELRGVDSICCTWRERERVDN